jgi:hypothetical protein
MGQIMLKYFVYFLKDFRQEKKKKKKKKKIKINFWI